MGARRKAREIAFQSLYSWEMNELSQKELMQFDWVEDTEKAKLSEDIKAFARIIIAGVIENLEVIDKAIEDHLTNWKLSRVNRVDLAILRLSVFALIYQKDIPKKVVIDEAIGISKKFSVGEAYKFVNGVLDNISKDIK